MYGYKTTTQGWPVYLQRVLDFDRHRHFGIISRMWNGLVNREIPREAKSRSVVELGIQVRRHLLQGHPWAERFDELCRAHPKTAEVYATAVAHPLSWHERQVATTVASGRGAPADLESLWDWYSPDDASSVRTEFSGAVVEVLENRRTASVRELIRSCHTVEESSLTGVASTRIEMALKRLK